MAHSSSIGAVKRQVDAERVGRVEYLYDDFGHVPHATSDGDAYRISLKAQTVRGCSALARA